VAKVYISLGTNLGDKEHNLQTAILEVQELCGILEQTSSIYSSAPWGFKSFNNFLNQVISIKCELSPKALMQELLIIENKLGRNRNSKNYQDRTIDLDILFYDDLILHTKELQIPHPMLHKRNFILQPLFEIDPGFVHPLLQKNIEQLLRMSSDHIKAFKK